MGRLIENAAREARRLPGGRGALLAVLAAASLAGGWLLLGPGTGGGGTATAEEAGTSAAIAPLPWEGEEKPDPYEGLDEPEFITAKKHGVENMPPASAGSNGSYTPRPAHERERFETAKHVSGISPEDAALMLGDIAIPPSHAPAEIQAVINAANQITDQPYRWGGGHAGWRSRGYDCSGAVSYALAGGGLIGAPATSGQLMGWGRPGKGRWLTIYANPGHVYAVVAGLRFDTVGLARGSGPRWHPADAYPEGYVARHIPGL
jgi:cell wall-associated NlpC family hydrolase